LFHFCFLPFLSSIFDLILPCAGKTHQHAQRLTISVVDTFIEDLKSSVREAKESPSGKGTMVAVYGTFLCHCRYYLSRLLHVLSIIKDVPVILFHSFTYFCLHILHAVTLIGHTL
jgi:hypothetical protein